MVDLSIVFCMFTRGYPHHPHHPLLRRRRLQRSQASPTKSHLAGMVSSYKGPKKLERTFRKAISFMKKKRATYQYSNLRSHYGYIQTTGIWIYVYDCMYIYIYIIYIQINIYLYHLKKISSRGWRCWPGPLARLQRFQGAGLRMVVKETRQRLRDLTPQAGQGRDANHRHVPLFHYGTMEVNGG